jgi:alkylation response protein AidB-like acyl-CoA dehydrogenase/DNA-binding transcriptional ArsR family regulator
MEKYPWWTEAQKRLADEVKEAVDELMPLAEEYVWRKEYPWELMREIGKRGWLSPLIPKEYGGRLEDWGSTGGCIIMEELGRLGETGAPYAVTLFGGPPELVRFGTEEQKRKWLPDSAKGRLGALTLTEPFVGSDAAAIETTARRDGDVYIINGKKRFISNGAAADVYLTYVKTSDKPEDRARYRHVTALLIEKGTPGFTVEKVNDLMGFDGMYNCYFNYDNARVPVANSVGEEGDGWLVMMSGLNVERTIASAGALGSMREALKYAVYCTERRLQFRQQRTIDIPINNFKIADMVCQLNIARLLTYYTAYLYDLGKEPALESSIAKLFNTDAAMQTTIDAIQCMGGEGCTKYYPVERLMRDAKVAQITAGTNEIMRLMIYRMGLTAMAEDLKVPRRVIHPELKVPMPVAKGMPPKANAGEDDILEALAENYRVNPGLYMTREELKEVLSISDEDMDKHLTALEGKGLAKLYRGRRGDIRMARATFEGLAKAKPPEYYRYIPEWVKKEDVF